MSVPNSKWFPKFKKGLEKVPGKTFVITGTTTGTGFSAAKTMGELGAEKVILLNRPSERSTKSLEKLKEQVPNGNFYQVDCDLLDFDSVRNGIEKVKELTDEVDCLSLNAGIMATPDEATPQGYDKQMQCNHLSHFLITKELYPLVEAAAEKRGEGRIVTHSSEARKGPPLQEKYFEKNGGNLGGDESSSAMSGPAWKRYHQTKLANIVFTTALADKLQAKGSKVKSVSAHPGISLTNLGDHLNFGSGMAIKLIGMIAMSPEDGSMGLITGMVGKDVQSKELYGPNRWLPWGRLSGPATKIKLRPEEVDKAQQELLWKMSEKACGKFDL